MFHVKHRAESLPRIPGEPWAGSRHRARGFRMTGLPATLGESFRWRRSAGFAFSVPVGLSSESFQMPGIVVFARRTALRPAGETSCAEAAIIAERHFSISRPVETDAPTRISRPPQSPRSRITHVSRETPARLGQTFRQCREIDENGGQKATLSDSRPRFGDGRNRRTPSSESPRKR